MPRPDNAVRIRRELMVRVARLHRENRLLDAVDRIPIEMAPRASAPLRCCTYKDRAVLKYRLMAVLGHGMESEVDELTSLGTYAAETMARVGDRRAPGDRHAAPGAPRGRQPHMGAPDEETPLLSVLDIACASCSGGKHRVTDACHGCMARSCVAVCPKGAITGEEGRAAIDPASCINCGLCAAACRYRAIIYQPVPCEEACPVGAMGKNDAGVVEIDEERCIACGRCLGACPFAAVLDRSQMVEVLEQLRGPRRVVAAVAPAGIGQFSAPFERLVGACRQLGFDDVYEVAAGADRVAASEAAELDERLAGGAPFMTSSCCPAWTAAVERHFNALTPYVSHTSSPMVVVGREIHAVDPDSIVVFVGPCLAKKREAERSGVIDYCLSFEELGAMFVANDIDVQEADAQPATTVGSAGGRGFAVAGGVAAAVAAARPEVATTRIDGIDRETRRTLDRLAKQPEQAAHRPDGAQFIEVMACSGGCVGGPLAYGTAKSAARAIERACAAPALTG